MKSQAWRDFFITLLLLGLAFSVALLSSIAAEQREDVTAGVAAAISLLLALAGALYIVPRLARNVRLEFIKFAVRTTITVEGVLFVVLLAVIGISAWNTRNNLLYLVLAALLSFLIASNLLSRVSLSDIAVQLRFPDHLFAGEPASLTITMLNHKRLLPSYSILVEGVAKSGKSKSKDEEDASQEDGKEESEDEDKAPRMLVARSPERGVGKLAYFVIAPPRARIRQRVEYTFEKRGLYPINGFKVSTKFPTGFFKKWRTIDAEGGILVYPKPQPLDDFYHALPMLTGQIQSQSKGFGDDLYAIRRYYPSDHMRYIDWKATAKSRDIMVREHIREDEWRLTIVLDTASPNQRASVPQGLDVAGNAVQVEHSDDEGCKCNKCVDARYRVQFERAIVMAASLANHFVLERAHVELVTSRADHSVESGTGYGQLYRILKSLATLEPAVSKSVEELSKATKRKFWRRNKSTGESEEAEETTEWARLEDVPVLADERRFKILITSASKGSIPARIWRSAHVVFMEDL